MKKTLKELLWFVIPTVLIVAMYATIYAIVDSQINTPKWIGMNEYFLLFSKFHKISMIHELLVKNKCYMPSFQDC